MALNIGRVGPRFRLDGVSLSLGAIVVIAILAWWLFLRK